jgi:thiamine-monophosphate kinase
VINPNASSRGTAGAGEFALIAAIVERLGTSDDVLVGPGDDAALVSVPDGKVVASTDVLVDGVHFRRDWSSAQDVGVRAAAANLADVVAMGARPVALLVGLALPGHVDRNWVLGLADGLSHECERAGAAVVGGDIVASEQLVVSVTALGSLEGRAPVLRSGAKVGDVVAVGGRQGWAAAGLAVLTRGFRSPKVLADAHRRPEPNYAAGLAAAPHATAMCDVSDGLVADLGHVARASGVDIDLSAQALDGLVTDAMRDVGSALGGADPLAWILGGGDDHAFVATFAASAALPEGWTSIGRVSGQGEGVVLLDGADPGVTGHEHRVG